MKRICALAMVLILLAGCADNGAVAASADLYIVSERYYEVYEISKHGRPMYQYYIFAGDHTILDYDILYSFPEITKSGAVVKLTVRVDTGVFCCRYFDIEKNLSSIWFVYPIAETESLVAYTDQPWEPKKLIVQDIFDKSKFYMEIERDLSKHYRYPIWAEFINDGKQLEMKYESGSEQYMSEVIDLTSGDS